MSDSHSASASRFFAQQAGQIILTSLQELELANAIQLRLFRKDMEAAEAQAARQALANDRRQGIFLLAPFPEQAFAAALLLAVAETQRRGTRSLDLLHVAAAVELEADRFLTYDSKQRGLAQAAGLAIVR